MRHAKTPTLRSRRLRRAVPVLLSCLLSAAGGFALAVPAAEARPTPGLNANWGSEDGAMLGTLQRQGYKIGRQYVAWSQVETTNGRFNWAGLDAVNNNLSRYGMKPLWTVTHAPAWAGGCAGANCPPSISHDADWKAFIAQLGARYPQAAGIEIWNEPNLTAFWSSPSHTVDPARWATLVKLANQTTQVPVVAGAPAGTDTRGAGPGGMGAGEFLTAAYKAGLKGNFDIMGAHPYPGLGPLLGSFRAKLDAVRDVMQDNGDAKPIWITETFISTTGNPANFPILSEAEQARMVPLLYTTAAAMPDVTAMIFFGLREPLNDPSNWNSGMGLIGFNGNFKPVFYTLPPAFLDPPRVVPQPTVTATSWNPDRAQRVTFTATLPAGVDVHKVQWDTNGNGAYDGQTDTQLTLTQRFNQPGRYRFSFWAYDHSDSYRFSRYIVVKGNRAPVAKIKVLESGKAPVKSLVVRTGLPITFDSVGSADADASGYLRRWVWQVGIERKRSKLASGARFTRVYSKPGTYRVKLTVWDNLVMPGFRWVKIKVVSNPARARINIVRTGRHVTFDATGSLPPRGASSTLKRYVWYVGIERGLTKIVTGRTFERDYTQGGAYKVRLKVIDSNRAQGFAAQTFVVSVPPKR